MEFIKTLQQKEDFVLSLLTGTDSNGQRFFAYFLARGDVTKILSKKALSKTSIDLNEYGEVIFKGKGNTPSNDVENYVINMFNKHYCCHTS